MLVSTQRRVEVGMSGMMTVGLDYAACAARLGLCGLWDEQVARGLRVVEHELVTAESEARAKANEDREREAEHRAWVQAHRPAGMRLIEAL